MSDLEMKHVGSPPPLPPPSPTAKEEMHYLNLSSYNRANKTNGMTRSSIRLG